MERFEELTRIEQFNSNTATFALAFQIGKTAESWVSVPFGAHAFL